MNAPPQSMMPIKPRCEWERAHGGNRNFRFGQVFVRIDAPRIHGGVVGDIVPDFGMKLTDCLRQELPDSMKVLTREDSILHASIFVDCARAELPPTRSSVRPSCWPRRCRPALRPLAAGVNVRCTGAWRCFTNSFGSTPETASWKATGATPNGKEVLHEMGDAVALEATCVGGGASLAQISDGLNPRPSEG